MPAVPRSSLGEALQQGDAAALEASLCEILRASPGTRLLPAAAGALSAALAGDEVRPDALDRGLHQPACICFVSETNRMHWALFGMQNRTMRPYLAVHSLRCRPWSRCPGPGTACLEPNSSYLSYLHEGSGVPPGVIGWLGLRPGNQ
jgi:hypothetical protein